MASHLNLGCVVERTAQSSELTLGEAYERLGGDASIDIPWLVRLLENPKSRIALPGSISLFNHDCLHILLDLGFSPEEEAFLVGFSMGSDPSTRPLHLMMLKSLAKTLYPHPYRFSRNCCTAFDLGVKYGRIPCFQNLHHLEFSQFKNVKISKLRKHLKLTTDIYLDGKYLSTMRADSGVDTG